MRIKEEEQIARRRDIIIAAAREIMETEGLEALSIRKLANSLHQTPGIIYHYFAGKRSCSWQSYRMAIKIFYV